jgi:hypothetical protein
MCPQDASWRDAGEFVGASVFDGECVTIRAGWPARDLPPIAAGTSRAILPALIVGHWAFDRKELLIVIGDDEEKRLSIGHAVSCLYDAPIVRRLLDKIAIGLYLDAPS